MDAYDFEGQIGPILENHNAKNQFLNSNFRIFLLNCGPHRIIKQYFEKSKKLVDHISPARLLDNAE